MHNHRPAKARPRQGVAWAQPQIRRGKTKTKGSLCTTTAQARQDWDQGKPEHNQSPANARSRPGVTYAQWQPSIGKTKTGGILQTNTWKLHRILWELHGTSSELHGTARGLYGTSWDLYWTWRELLEWLNFLSGSISFCGYHLFVTGWVYSPEVSGL